jgi:hypothetical protein
MVQRKLVLHVERHGEVFDIRGLADMTCWDFLGSSTDRFVLAVCRPSESSFILYVFDLERRNWFRLGGLPAALDTLWIEQHACSGSGNTIAVVMNEGYDYSLHVMSVNLDDMDFDRMGVYSTRSF